MTYATSPSPVQNSPHRSWSSPKVVIKCITYNHEAYIRDALEGFVMQQTNFPFIAIVHDDASTDGTSSIIREYAKKYPHIIKPIYETENQYSKRDGTLDRIMSHAVKASGAPYVAVCEGDDYWTDPLKLQKQVDFLDNHPDYSMVFARARCLYDTGLSNDIYPMIPIESREYTSLELYHNIVPTPTILYRIEALDSRCFNQLCNSVKKVGFGDLTICMVCSSIGKVFGMSDVVSVYRRLNSGATIFLLRKNPLIDFNNRIAISKYFGKEFKQHDYDSFSGTFVTCCKHIHKNFPKNLKFILRYIWVTPLTSIRLFGNIPNGLYRRVKHFFYK